MGTNKEWENVLPIFTLFFMFLFSICVVINLFFPQGMALSLGDKINLSQKKANI